MDTDPFPYVDIPKKVSSIVGEKEEGKRVYMREGSEEEAGFWFEAIEEIIGQSVSPGGVLMFCPVTRAAVHRRIKKGKLSAFKFHSTYVQTNLFGKNRVLRDTPYVLIPVSEAKAWKVELEKEALRRGYVDKEELEGNEPDWHGEFLQWKNKKERIGYLDRLKMDGITITEDIKATIMARLKGEYTWKPKQRKKK